MSYTMSTSARVKGPAAESGQAGPAGEGRRRLSCRAQQCGNPEEYGKTPSRRTPDSLASQAIASQAIASQATASQARTLFAACFLATGLLAADLSADPATAHAQSVTYNGVPPVQDNSQSNSRLFHNYAVQPGVNYDFGHGWRYRMDHETQELFTQYEFLMNQFPSHRDEGPEGRFKLFLSMDADGAIGEDGYRVITQEEARSALQGAEARYKVEVLGIKPSHNTRRPSATANRNGNAFPNYALYSRRPAPQAQEPAREVEPQPRPAAQPTAVPRGSRISAAKAAAAAAVARQLAGAPPTRGLGIAAAPAAPVGTPGVVAVDIPGGNGAYAAAKPPVHEPMPDFRQPEPAPAPEPRRAPSRMRAPVVSVVTPVAPPVSAPTVSAPSVSAPPDSVRSVPSRVPAVASVAPPVLPASARPAPAVIPRPKAPAQAPTPAPSAAAEPKPQLKQVRTIQAPSVLRDRPPARPVAKPVTAPTPARSAPAAVAKVPSRPALRRSATRETASAPATGRTMPTEKPRASATAALPSTPVHESKLPAMPAPPPPPPGMFDNGKSANAIASSPARDGMRLDVPDPQGGTHRVTLPPLLGGRPTPALPAQARATEPNRATAPAGRSKPAPPTRSERLKALEASGSSAASGRQRPSGASSQPLGRAPQAGSGSTAEVPRGMRAAPGTSPAAAALNLLNGSRDSRGQAADSPTRELRDRVKPDFGATRSVTDGDWRSRNQALGSSPKPSAPPSPVPQDFKSKHDDRNAVGPVFHTKPTNLWSRAGGKRP